MHPRSSILISLVVAIFCIVGASNGFAISSEPVYNEAGEKIEQTGPNQSGNPLAISSEPVYKGTGGSVQNGPALTGNPLAISSEPVYRGGPNIQGGSSTTGNPLAISSEPVYRGGGSPANSNAPRQGQRGSGSNQRR